MKQWDKSKFTPKQSEGSSRRQPALADLGIDFIKEDEKQEVTLVNEQERTVEIETEQPELLNIAPQHMESSRRQQALADLGMDFNKEDEKREAALAKEQERADKKEAKRQELMEMASYRYMVTTAKYMDKYCIDPLLGFIPGGIGDTLSSIAAVPFVYFSLCKVKSIPLTLAVIYNILMDVLLGSIPFLGDIFDFFKRSYIANLKLITGYIEDDKEIINKVHKKALWTAVLIVVLLGLICMVVALAIAVLG